MTSYSANLPLFGFLQKKERENWKEKNCNNPFSFKKNSTDSFLHMKRKSGEEMKSFLKEPFNSVFFFIRRRHIWTGNIKP